MSYKIILGRKCVLQKGISGLMDSICKICLENEGCFEGDALISPCNCKGTMQYVHRECLRRWRYHKKNLSTINSCDQCKTMYEVVDEYMPRHLVINFLTFMLFCSIILLSNFILNTLLEAYIYTYRMCKSSTSFHDLLKGINKHENKNIVILERILKDSSVYKMIIYFAFVNILFSRKRNNWILIVLYFLFLWRSFVSGKQIDHYFLISFSFLNLRTLYFKFFEYIYSTVLYFLNY